MPRASSMRIKTFSGNESGELEDAVNGWLANHPHADVVQFAQTESAGDAGDSVITLTLLYREAANERRDGMALLAEEDLINELVMELPDPERVATPA